VCATKIWNRQYLDGELHLLILGGKPSTALLPVSAGSAAATISYAMSRSWHQPAMENLGLSLARRCTILEGWRLAARSKSPRPRFHWSSLLQQLWIVKPQVKSPADWSPGTPQQLRSWGLVHQRWLRHAPHQDLLTFKVRSWSNTETCRFHQEEYMAAAETWGPAFVMDPNT
jgi:hypothetical protein